MSRYKRKKKPEQTNAEKAEVKKIEEKAEELEAVEEETEEVEEAVSEDIKEPEGSESVDAEDADEAEEDSGEETEEAEEAEEEDEEEAEKKPKKAAPAEKTEPVKIGGLTKEEFNKLSFVEKCKKDPLIPVMLLLAVITVIVAAIYFIMPSARIKSLGITLEEFKTRFNSADVAVEMYNNGHSIGINYTDYYDATATTSILGDKATFTVDPAYADFFYGDVALLYTIGLEGATRKIDNEIAFFRLFVKYNSENQDDAYLLAFVYANTLQALFPDLTKFDAETLAMSEMSEYTNDGLYTVRGDYAFRLIPFTSNDADQMTYIAIEVVPKDSLNASQIKKTLEIPQATAAVIESTSASVSETAAAT